MNFLSLAFGKIVWRTYSLLILLVLRLRGITVGSGLYVEGTPKLAIRGRADNIRIGDNVRLLGSVDFRNREEGQIIISDDVTIEDGCRFVAAQQGRIEIGRGSSIGAGAIWNGGGSIMVGEECAFGVRSSINANDHLHDRNQRIRHQGFAYQDVTIGDDCWFGANVCVNKGVTVGQGTIVGAGGVVTTDTEPYSINAGVPCRKISER